MKNVSMKTIAGKLKSCIKEMSDDHLVEIASGRRGIAIFPNTGKDALVQHDLYFSHDCQDGAAEQYWTRFGPRAVLSLPVNDDGLYELPIDWLYQLQELVEGDESLAGHWETFHDLLARGLVSKAEELRKTALCCDLEGEVRDAMLQEWGELKGCKDEG